MRKVIVNEFMSLDGVVQAPGGAEEDTSGGFAHGGWHMRYPDDVGRERIVQARQLLMEGMSVKEVSVVLGFPTPKDFSREFLILHEVTPTEFQRRHDAERDRRLD